MRIGFYIPQLARGGAERVIINLSKQFTEKNNSVYIITTTKTSNEYSVPEGVKRYILVEKDKIDRRGVIKRNRDLRAICKIEQLDLLVSFIGGANYHAVLAARSLKTKVVISVRNDPRFEYPKRIDKLLIKCILTKADGCVFQTEEAKQYFPKELQDKSRIIYNAVANEFYSTQMLENKNSRVIVSCGRLVEQKNFKLLIKAFGLVSKHFENVVLKIYGEGEQKKELQNLINNLDLGGKIFLMGNTENVAEALAEATIFVLTSNFEGMPNALMEAMAMGLPCVATDCPCGGPKMLLNNNNGILVPINDTNALYKAIFELLSDPVKLRIISKNAREASIKFKEDCVFKEWEEYFNFVLNMENEIDE